MNTNEPVIYYMTGTFGMDAFALYHPTDESVTHVIFGGERAVVVVPY